MWAAPATCSRVLQPRLLKPLFVSGVSGPSCSYIYTDTINMDMEPAAAAAALQVGLYYGAPRLVSLCEVVMCSALTDQCVSPAGEATYNDTTLNT